MIIRFILVGIEGAYNLGVIARTLVNFNIDELYIVNPSVDLNEALNYAAKGRDYLSRAIIVNDIDEAIKESDLVVATSGKGYSEGDVLRQAISVEDFINLIQRRRVDRLAVMFGRESVGLTRDELSKADILVTIPANPSYPILNVSQAVAIFAWELWKIRGIQPENIPPRASRKDIDMIIEVLDNISKQVFTTSDKVARLNRVWKNTLYKASLSAYESRLLLYWARRVYRKISGVQSG